MMLSLAVVGYKALPQKATLPPLLGTRAFSGVSSIIPITIPCGSQASYNSRWGYFSNFNEEVQVLYTVSATSADSAMGSVSILSTPTCTDSTVVLSATANSGYQFNHWSDHNTDNPRTLTLSRDTLLVAYFTIDDYVADTVFILDTVIVHDTTFINNYFHDTTYITNYIHDTTYINTFVHDTLIAIGSGL